MLKRHTRPMLAAALALTFPMVAACGGSAGGESGGSGADEPYKVGASLALSGDQASLGKDFATFLEYGIADVNEQYADEGIELELVLEDNGAAAEQGVASFNKLATVEEVPLVITGWSAVVNAMAPMAEDFGTAIMNSGANAPELEGASPLLSNFYTLASVEMEKFATYVHDDLGLTKAGVIYVDNPSGEGGGKVYRDAFEEAGGQVTGFESVAPGAVDVSSTVTKILDDDPDVVHIHTTSTEGGGVIKALRDQGFDGQITTFASVGSDAASRNTAGPAADGVIYSVVKTYDREDPQAAELIERFRTEEGRDPVGLSYDMNFYDSIFLYAELVQKLRDEDKEITGESLIEAMKSGSFEVPLQGEVTFTDDLTREGAVQILKINDAAAAVGTDEPLQLLE